MSRSRELWHMGRCEDIARRGAALCQMAFLDVGSDPTILAYFGCWRYGEVWFEGLVPTTVALKLIHDIKEWPLSQQVWLFDTLKNKKNTKMQQETCFFLFFAPSTKYNCWECLVFSSQQFFFETPQPGAVVGDAWADVFEVAVGHYTSGTTRGGNADGRRAVVAPPFFVDTSVGSTSF